MSQHFWMMAGATIVVAGVAGVGLGSFATNTPHAPMRDGSAVQAAYEDSYASSTPSAFEQPGPVIVRCTGCGPTLADRQWHVEEAELYPDTVDPDAMTDPVVAQDMAYGEPAPVPAHRMQPSLGQTHPITEPVMISRTVGAEAVPSLSAPDVTQESGDRPRS